MKNAFKRPLPSLVLRRLMRGIFKEEVLSGSTVNGSTSAKSRVGVIKTVFKRSFPSLVLRTLMRGIFKKEVLLGSTVTGSTNGKSKGRSRSTEH